MVAWKEKHNSDDKGRTVIIQKEASNYHRITCLSLTWKLWTGMTADETYGSLKNKGKLPEERKGCRKKSKDRGNQLNIDKMQELSNGDGSIIGKLMTCPLLLVIEGLNMMSIAKNVVNILGKKMKS